MKKFIIFSFILLTACQHTYEGVKAGAMADTKPYRKKIAQRIYPDDTPEPVKEEYYYPQSYCYKTWSDVTCYEQPQAGQEDRLIGR